MDKGMGGLSVSGASGLSLDNSLLRSYQYAPWFFNFVYRILTHEKDVLLLLDLPNYPFRDSPPKFVRATLYLYRFSNFSSREEKSGENGEYGESWESWESWESG